MEPLPGKLVTKPLQAVRKTSKVLIVPDVLQACAAEAVVTLAVGSPGVDEASRASYFESTGLNWRLLDLEAVVLKSANALALVCDG